MLMGLFGYAYVFLTKYLIPLFFAFGIIMMLFGIVKYYIMDEREAGRVPMLWAFLCFLIGIAIYGLMALFMWLGATFTELGEGVETGETIRLQQVPDVPRTND